MNRCALALTVTLCIATLAVAQGIEPVPALFTSNAPTLDGTIRLDEWWIPGTEIISSVSDPSPVIVNGSFTGADDLTITGRALFTADQIYLAFQIRDDVVAEDDVLHVDVGLVSFRIQAGEETEGPEGEWQVVKLPGDPWSLEIRVPAAVAMPTVFPGTVFSYNVRFEDDDGGADGEMWRNVIGAGLMEPVVPQADLLDAATLLESLDPQFDGIGNLEKRAAHLRKAARNKRWTDAYTYASKSAASKSLERVRKAIKKLQKYQVRTGPVLGSQLDRPLALMIRAARMASERLVMLAMQTGGPTPTTALERQAQAETALAAGDLQGAAKLFRKAAKKAAKLVF